MYPSFFSFGFGVFFKFFVLFLGKFFELDNVLKIRLVYNKVQETLSCLDFYTFLTFKFLDVMELEKIVGVSLKVHLKFLLNRNL